MNQQNNILLVWVSTLSIPAKRLHIKHQCQAGTVSYWTDFSENILSFVLGERKIKRKMLSNRQP